MKSLGVLLVATAATGIAGFGPAAFAVESGPLVQSAQAEMLPHTWFVQLKSAPAADGTSISVVRAEKSAFRSAASKAGIKFQERYSYDTLFNGLSIRASRGEVQRIKALPGVTAVWPVAIVDAPPKGSEPAPDLFTAIDMTGATIAQNELGFDGKGIKVAVMDTGIDVDHPAFGGSGVARSDSPLSDRVAYGYDFVGDAFNADSTSRAYNPIPDAR